MEGDNDRIVDITDIDVVRTDVLEIKMNLDQLLIENLPATSSITIRKLKSLGVNTYFDLLNYFPSRYEDYSLITKINKIQEGETVTIKGKIVEAKNQYTRSRITIQKVLISDNTGI